MGRESKKNDKIRAEERGRSYLTFFNLNAAEENFADLPPARIEQMKREVLNRLEEPAINTEDSVAIGQDQSGLMAFRKRKSSHSLLKRTVIPAAAVLLISFSLLLLIKIMDSKKAVVERAADRGNEEISEAFPEDMAEEPQLNEMEAAAENDLDLADQSPIKIDIDQGKDDPAEEKGDFAPGAPDQADEFGVTAVGPEAKTELLAEILTDDRFLLLEELFYDLNFDHWQDNERLKESLQNILASLLMKTGSQTAVIFGNDQASGYNLTYIGYLAVALTGEDDENIVLAEIESYLERNKYSYILVGEELEPVIEDIKKEDETIGEKLADLAAGKKIERKENVFVWLIWQ